MRSISTFAVASTVLAGCANAISLLPRRPGVAPRVVQHDIQRKEVENPVARDRARRQRRDSTYSVDLANEETLYFMNVSIGTPAQKLRLHIDTGSSDLWVNVANSTICEYEDEHLCAASGTYAANASSTYEYLNSDFNITYVDGSGAAGDYATDVVSFGSVTLDKQQFGIGLTSTSEEGIIGIGYPINEVAVTYTGKSYPNVPEHMMDDGLIASNAYSLWLNDLDASTGSILFGGVNTDKYTGDLYTLPIITEDGVYAEFIIALTAVGANGTAGSYAKGLAEPALLDSGSSLMYLPNDIVESIYEDFGAEYDSSQGAAFVDCSLAKSDGSIDLTFSEPTISVALSELVIVAGTEGDKEVCILGISPADGSTPVLGDTFLRSAYVVYDMTANTISIAQTDFNSTSDNILEITNGTAIPSATAVANAVTSVAVSSGDANINDFTSVTVTQSAFGLPTAALGYNAALIGAVGAGMAFAL